MRYRNISRPVLDNTYSPRFIEPESELVGSPIIEDVPTVEESSTPKPEESPAPKRGEPSNNPKSFSGKKDFLSTMVPIYEKILSENGLNPAFAKSLAAQDGLESGWGRSAQGRFNYGNITLGSNKTRSYVTGRDKDKDGNPITQKFVNYDSLEDYAQSKVNLLNGSRYRAFEGAVQEFADRVARGGYAEAPNYAEALRNVIASAKKGGVLKFQEGGTAEIRPDNRSWLRKQYDNLATKYNSSAWANSAPAEVLAGLGGPYGIVHYALAGDTDAARIAALPGAVVVNNATKELLKEVAKGVDLVYSHYGDDISKYLRGALDNLRNSSYGVPALSERAAVPKRILSRNIIPGNNFGHDYAFWKDPKTGETILRVNTSIQYPERTGAKAAAKQFLQELVGTTKDAGLIDLSSKEYLLFPEKYLKSGTISTGAKDAYSRLMGLKAEAGIKSSFDALTPEEAKKLYDLAWDANVFYPTVNTNSVHTKETFWKENKDAIMSVFKRIPAIVGPAVVGYSIYDEKEE